MKKNIRVVCWNIDKRHESWRELDRMARQGEADVALLQEAGKPPGDMAHLKPHDDEDFKDREPYDRWPVVLQLSDRVKIERFRQVSPAQRVRRDGHQSKRLRHHSGCADHAT